MLKSNRRETMVLLLGGLACLGGCQTSSGFKKPSLPENCYWMEFPYAWVCLPLERPEPSKDVPSGVPSPTQDKVGLYRKFETSTFRVSK